MTIIKRYRVGATDLVVFEAWEPSTIMGRHSSITFIDGKCHGRIGTDPDRALYEHLPRGNERTAAVDAAYAARYEAAYEAIHAAYPETRAGHHDLGEIVMSEADAPAAKKEAQS